MANVTRSEDTVNDEPFQSLYRRFKFLEIELNTMQTEYQKVSTYYGQQRMLSLGVSMTSLFEVISCVNKADKALVEWHYRSKHLKRALRLVGLDRRTHVLIEKKNQKLKKKVSAVEQRCSEASDNLGIGVEATSRLRQEFVTFSVNTVGKVSKEAIQTRDVYDKDRKHVQTKITVQEIETEDVKAQVASTQGSLTQLRERSDEAETARDACRVGSYSTFSVAAASAVAGIFFPVSLVATVPLLAFGAASASAASSYGQEVNSLELQQEELNSKIANQETAINALIEEISNLNSKHQRCTDILQMIEELQDNTGTIRAEVQKTLDRLREDSMILNRVRTDLEAMREQLEECQYAKTRRDIAKKLHEIVASMQNVSGNEMLLSNQPKVNEAMQALTEIDEKTKEVVEISSLALRGTLWHLIDERCIFSETDLFPH